MNAPCIQTLGSQCRQIVPFIISLGCCHHKFWADFRISILPLYKTASNPPCWLAVQSFEAYEFHFCQSKTPQSLAASTWLSPMCDVWMAAPIIRVSLYAKKLIALSIIACSAVRATKFLYRWRNGLSTEKLSVYQMLQHELSFLRWGLFEMIYVFANTIFFERAVHACFALWVPGSNEANDTYLSYWTKRIFCCTYIILLSQVLQYMTKLGVACRGRVQNNRLWDYSGIL